MGRKLENRRKTKAARTAAYKAGYESGGESKYAKKLRLKTGRGHVEPTWMWWTEGPAGR